MYKYNDNELLYLIAENNDYAKNVLINKYKPLVIKNAKNIARDENEMEDYMQEGMLCIIKAINTFNDKYPYSFNNYLNIILKRKYIDIVKKRKSNEVITYCDTLEENVIDYLTLCGNKEEKYIEENNIKLSNFELSVYQYKFIDDIKPNKIAEIMKKDIKQIYDAINRIRNKMGKNNKKI